MSKRTVAIVLAAGQGKRMNSNVHKQYLLLQDKPVLYYTLKAFEDSFVEDVVLVVGSEEEEYCRENIIEKYHFQKVRKIVVGGAERYHSVYAGLKELATWENIEDAYIFIHDGARPFVTEEILKTAYACVEEEHACIVGMPVKDTIKVVDERGYVDQTLNRSRTWSVQTPQVFSYRLIKTAYELMIAKEDELKEQGIQITDDAMVVETFTKAPVRIVCGSYDNIKITTPEDLLIAQEIVSKTIEK